LNFDASVRFIPNLDRGRYFALMRQSACLVDTLEFSGFNTAIQALQCDLPVLAYEGQFMRGRLASALLRKLDLPTLIARTQREFVDKAVELARDATKRRSLRSAIGQRRELLFRDSTAVRALEDVLSHEVSRARACTGSG
jgi:predicted O-linked N-acetylglucosamine transferase (SPINDLY family)